MQSAVLERDGSIDHVARPRIGRKRLALSTAALAIAIGGGWYGYGWWTTGRFIESTDDAYVGGEVTTISPHVAGFISEVLITDNQRVRAGQVLLRLDPSDYKTAADHAQAVVDERQAALVNLQAQLVLQQSVIRQAAADLVAKTARANYSAEDARRYAALAETAAGSRQDAQRTLTAQQEAQSATLSSRAGLDAAEQRVAVLQASVQAAAAQLAEARSDLGMAQLNLGYTELRSPIDGVVGNRAARVGAYVSAGSYLLSVIPAQGLWVDANFKEDQLARMAPGQAAELVADVAPGRVLHGHVLSLGPGTGAIFSVIPPENATGNFTKIVQRVPVRIVLDDADGRLGTLRPGLSTVVSVDIRGQANGHE